MLNKRFEVKLVEKYFSKGDHSIRMEVYHKEKLINITQFCEKFGEEECFTVNQVEVQRNEDNIVFGLKGKIKFDHEDNSRLKATSFTIPYEDITKEEYVVLRDKVFKFSRAAELVDYLFNVEKTGAKEFEKIPINSGKILIYLDENNGLNDYKKYLETANESVTNILNEKGCAGEYHVSINHLSDYEYSTLVLALSRTKFKYKSETVVL